MAGQQQAAHADRRHAAAHRRHAAEEVGTPDGSGAHADQRHAEADRRHAEERCQDVLAPARGERAGDAAGGGDEGSPE